MSDNKQKSREAEAALIGAILRRPAIYADMAETVKPQHFDWVPYRDAWEAIARLKQNDMHIDQITLGDELERAGKLDSFLSHSSAAYSGRSAIAELRQSGASPDAAQSYAVMLADYNAKRDIVRVMEQGAEWALNGRRAGDILQDLGVMLGNINPPGMKSSRTQSMKQAIADAYRATDAASRGEVQYLNTGYSDLDTILEGITGPDFILIAARPGQGKTALLASIAKNMADGVRTGAHIQDKKRVVIFTLEMSNQQLAMRFLAMESGVSFGKQKKGAMTMDEWERYNAAVERMGNDEYPVILNDIASITPNAMRRELRKLGKVDLIMLDYIQLSGSDDRAENRVNELGKISRALKLIAKEFNVPLIAAAQLSRAVETRADKQPMLSDLRESGTLEQDADTVIFIWREDDISNISKVRVAKHRNGACGSLSLAYIAERTRFENATLRKVEL